jgi:S-formylglutathione hydrolase FrmB
MKKLRFTSSSKLLHSTVLQATVVLLLVVTHRSGSGQCYSTTLPSVRPVPSTSQLRGAQALTLTGVTQLDGQLKQYTFTTPALPAPTNVEVLFPSDYDSNPRKRYPVVYLLGGADLFPGGDPGNGYIKNLGLETLAQGLEVIFVMPSGGCGGDYTDWYAPGEEGQFFWESYDIYELLPWIDQNLRTLGTREGRAVAGISMGGLGSIGYPARHPDLFVAAASFSGVVSLLDPASAEVIPALSVADGGIAVNVYGPQATFLIGTEGHDPVTLSTNLASVDISMYTGNGENGPLDMICLPPSCTPSTTANLAEAGVHQEAVELDKALTADGITHYFDDYGPGTHSVPYWQRDLMWALPRIMQDFASPPPAPSSVTYKSTEAQYSIFGWYVDISRLATEFSSILQANKNGFVLTGSGTGSVVTPPLFVPNQVYQVTVGTVQSVIKASPTGSLTIAVPLGPPNLLNQDSPGSFTAVYTTAVSIQ